VTAPAGVAPPATSRLGAVEGLRATAAVLVVAFHLHRALLATHPGLLAGTPGLLIDRLGPLGVSIFFVLSGFLLYRPYALATLRAQPFAATAPYYVRRFVRIVPAYWLALGVFALTASYTVVSNGVDGITYFGLVQNYRSGYALRGIGVAWTLVIEVSFYLVLPWLARALRARDSATRRLIVSRQLAGIALLGAVGIGVRVWAIWIKGPVGQPDGAFAPWRSPNGWLVGYLDWFALGMLLAVVAAWVATGGRMPTPVRWLAGHAGVAWIVGFGAYAWIALTATFPPLGLPNPAMTQMLVTTLFPLAAALIVLPIALEPAGGGLRAVLRSVPFVAVGTVSYGIYLWHLIVIRWTQVWIGDGTIPRSAALQTVLVLAITGVIATLSYLVVERPLMRWSRQFSRRSRIAAVRSSPA
jgi:peptidoglycan/LPS O-acetylase OafA/YrhL